jgi:DNA-binding winged helix-turn-helix (wHTH) protein
LQDKQFQLLHLLARTPGECVGYEAIYTELWGAAVVEDNQMHFQKRKLLARIREAAPEHEELIKAIPKRGFVLDLPAQAVKVIASAARRERVIRIPAQIAMLV